MECDKPQSVWFLQAVQGVAPICSWCALYKVPWQDKSQDDIAAYIAAVEATQGREFEKDEQGRLLQCKDADRLVASLVLSCKVTKMMKVY